MTILVLKFTYKIGSEFLTYEKLNWPDSDSDFEKKSEVWLWLWLWPAQSQARVRSESGQFNDVNWRQENTEREQ